MQEGIIALSHMCDSLDHKGQCGADNVRAEQGPDAHKRAEDT